MVNAVKGGQAFTAVQGAQMDSGLLLNSSGKNAL
uniref:Uncharacterized protein n=1 Tax=Anguilla anguilla TaxID=7936 RepID=A0A0E9Q6V2_ANGAN